MPAAAEAAAGGGGGGGAGMEQAVAPRRFRLSSKRLKLVEKHLKSADELASKTVMPVQHSQAAAVINQNTEQRWLSRMVTNAIKELKHRVEVEGRGGVLSEEDEEDALASIMAARSETRARLLALREEKAQVEKRLAQVRDRVVEAQRSHCRQQQREQRPTVPDAGESGGAATSDSDAAAAATTSGVLPPSSQRSTAAANGGGHPKVELDGRELTILRTKSKRLADVVSELSDSMPKRLKSFKDTTQAVREWLEEEPTSLDRVLMREMPKLPPSILSKAAAPPPPCAPTNSSKAAAPPSSASSSSSSSSSRCLTAAGVLAQHLRQQQQQTR